MLLKRNLSKDYDPTGPYDFEHWKDCFDSSIKRRFETLHKDLLYTDKKQDFEEAIHAFEAINQILVEIGE